MNATDYSQFYDLDSYLSDKVRIRFQQDQQLSAFDFFCILIWKANRAKSKAAKRMLGKGYQNLDDAAAALTVGLAGKTTPKDRLKYLMQAWQLRLPTATAILTVLFPDDFTVYDVRVCGVLERDGFKDFRSLANRCNFDSLWSGYQEFKAAVIQAVPGLTPLRDKDRHLWGKSFALQLQDDIATGFEEPAPS